MSDNNCNLSMGEAASCFLNSLAPDKREVSQQEVHRFVRWYGRERSLMDISAPEVANYAERLSISDTDYEKKLELIRAFLAYAKKEGWSSINLAVHLKARKGKSRLQPVSRRESAEPITLTRQGHAQMVAELASLKSRRSQAIEEVRKAAADKDFRENAPLETARQQHGQLVGRIKELEQTLKTATIVEEKPETALKIVVGDSVVLRDLVSSEEIRYTIVSPREVDPAKAKISNASPIGKAVVGRSAGEVVEITVPSGKLSYRIEKVER